MAKFQNYRNYSEGRSSDFPPLSPTVQASQLLTPLQLDRLSIDDPHYCSHLKRSVMTTQPPQHNAVQRRVTKMGDNYFFLQKDIPVNQAYAKTALQLSEVRPWDQIVDRPLASHKVVQKELHLPFPQEHPYTSHISRFAVFPHTNRHTASRPATQPNVSAVQEDGTHAEPATVSVQTQTVPWVSSVGAPMPPTPYYVSQKAFESGQRVECQYLCNTRIEGADQANMMLWDLPRSQRHKRAFTYPAPSLQYGQPPVPTNTMMPSSHTPSFPITPNTQQAMNSIHTLLTRTTTYSEQFASSTPRGIHTPNIISLDNSFRSRQSQRPWTAESRGKYSRKLPPTPYSTQQKTSGYLFGTENYQGQFEHSNYQPQSEPIMEHPAATGFDLGMEGEKSPTTKVKVDQATQTEEEYFSEQSTHTEKQTEDKLPALTPSAHVEDTKSDHIQESYKLPQLSHNIAPPEEGLPMQPVNTNRPASAYFYTQSEGYTDNLRHNRSFSANAYIPRTVDSTRRLNGLYNGFSRTETLKRFHEQYPETAPDLRHYSIREGKRHIIHGSHAYYFH